MVTEAVRFIDSQPVRPKPNYELPSPSFEVFDDTIVLPDDVPKMQLSEWEQRNINSLLGHEVLRLSGIEDVLQQFNGDVLGKAGEVTYQRSLFTMTASDEAATQTGKKFRYAAFNALSLQWEGVPSKISKKPRFLRLGMGIIDANHIGYFFMRDGNAQPNNLVIFNNIESKSRSYAYLHGPNPDPKSLVYPVITDDVITSSYYFEHLRLWTQNAISDSVNAHIDDNSVQEILPNGIHQLPSRRQLFPLPQPLQTLAHAA